MEIMCLVKDRKQLVTAIEKYSGEKMKYMGPPTFAYKNESVTVLRDGTLIVENFEENKAMLDNFLMQVNVVPFADAIPLYAKERYRLRRSGLSIMDFDLVIACTSIVNNMVMVTNNAKHFKRVEGITIENWLDK